MIRFFDIIISLVGIIILTPFFIIAGIIIRFDSKGPVLFKQCRVGKNSTDFKILKFRTMHPNSDKIRSLTIGAMDPRVTRVGYFLRKFKFDELPQLINVLKGDMSIVGPRPEVRKYVELYSAEQNKVLSVPPGITDLSSIVFRNENELLSMADCPEDHYITEIMPEKLKLSLIYIRNHSIGLYFRIILLTITSILGFNTISKILIGKFIK